MPPTSRLIAGALAVGVLLPVVAVADKQGGQGGEAPAAEEAVEEAPDLKGAVEEAPDSKAAAKALVKAAFEHVYEGEHALALEKFERAHDLFPSPKILLNIGTTLNKLGRYAESAALYERYLRHPETDASREAEVRRELADVIERVAHLRILVNVDGATIVVDGKPVRLGEGGEVRVDPGSHSIVASKKDHKTRTVSAFDVKARETRTVRLGLVSHGELAEERARQEARAFEQGRAAAISAIKSQHIETRHRPGASFGVAVAVQEPAASGLVGLSYGLSKRVDLEASALIGSNIAAYAGGRLFITTDRVRFSVSGGVPVFFIDGAKPGVRGGGAIGALITNRIGVTLDLGIEHYFDIGELDSTLVVPRLVLEARL